MTDFGAGLIAVALVAAALILAIAIGGVIPHETTQHHTGVTRQVHMSKAEWEEEQRLREGKQCASKS